MTPLRASRPTRAEAAQRQECAHALREVMRDGAWHKNTELARLVGPFGPALFLVRCGADGGPAWFIDVEALTSGFRYRFAGINPHPPKARRA